jgi:hypothetical protein
MKLAESQISCQNFVAKNVTSIEVSYPLGEGEEPGPDDTQAPTAKIDLKNISEGSTTTLAVSVSAERVFSLMCHFFDACIWTEIEKFP